MRFVGAEKKRDMVSPNERIGSIACFSYQ